MDKLVTYLVLILFILILAYGLATGNLWVIGVLCFPVVASGVYRVFKRHL